MIKVSRIDERDIKGLREKWDALFDKSAIKDNIFLTFDWVITWWGIYGEGKKLFVITIEKDSRLIGIAPLYVKLAPQGFKELRFLGDIEICPDHLGFIWEEKHKEIVVQGVVDYLKSNAGEWDVIDFIGIREEEEETIKKRFKMAGLIAQGKPYTVCPYVELPGKWDDYLRTFSSNRSSWIRRRTRVLLKDLEGSFLTHKDMGSIEDAHRHLVYLHQSRWNDRDLRGGCFSSKRFTEFHKAISRILAQSNSLILNFLKVKEEVVAALYGFRRNGKIYFYQSGFDERWNKYSVGSVIMSQSIKQAIDSQCSEYDMLRGDDAYKDIWAKKRRKDFRIQAFNNNLKGYALFALRNSAGTVKSLIKKVLPERVKYFLKKAN
ncbi:MAG: GNAT family N-acetyltransferase [Candidatus Omnitrophica bacterium]|nr:GNAT family N-acetyltransferase [Candidatus Omnitrophota bacterium]